MITQELVQKLFIYDDGVLVRRVYVRGNNARKGDCAGYVNSKGYLQTRIHGRQYKNHRLIWLLHYGYLPEHGLDHIDRDKTNNKIENLREVSQSCNMRNTGLCVTNTSGVKGVCWYKTGGKWMANIKINQKVSYLGYHDDFAEAVATRLAAEQCVGWDGCDDSSPAYQYMKEYLKTVD